MMAWARMKVVRQNLFLGGIWNVFHSSFTTTSPTNKWRAQADSARRVDLESVLVNFFNCGLVVLYITKKGASGILKMTS